MRFQKRQTKTSPGDYTQTLLTPTRAKLYLRETNSDQDDVISDLINSAIQHLESGLDFPIDTNSLIYQYYDSFGSDSYLPIWHRYIVSTDFEVYYWNDTTWTEFSSSNYRLDLASVPPKVFLKDNAEWPTDVSDDMNSVRVGFKVDTAHSFYDEAKAAMMALVASRYENPENSNGIPEAVTAFIKRHRL